MPTNRDEAIARAVNSQRVIGGSLFDVDVATAAAAAHYDRCFHPIGSAFQLAAVAASGDRTTRLAAVTTATLVIHGRLDSLITLPGGEATAAAIPGARLVIIDEMGHDLPAACWPQIIGEIAALAGRHG
jgi:pimeloyl-ACP methyl ester carboxylesterase